MNKFLEGLDGGQVPPNPSADNTTDLKEIGRLLKFIREARSNNNLPQSLRDRATEAIIMLRASTIDIDQLITLVNNASAPIARRTRALDILINVAIAGI